MKASSNSEPSAYAEGFPPIAAPGARILVLGSMPGQQSLRAQAYYAHPRNAFWPIMGQLLGFAPDAPYAQRAAMLQQHGIALWDVLQSCVRPGSLDADIDRRSLVCNDFPAFLATYPGITRICCNGAAAHELFRRHALPALGPEHPYELLRLPSTSPAHAGMTQAAKLDAWRAVLA
ncbi:DNA-deoxyinosine glycosylase [Pseudomonas sp. S 311-6]|uniref:DNA-deoxyinosine glycosylase n=1 Tax=Kerstersia gyiorum TaxID=206506 RepID=UPI00107146D8|nr:DNA-deoxyinosine glycosylase [Kerstersia gyiorum]MCO7642733.1 DNA-deoxyinosine glycosylase [Pseudomonas sp. S 311-6]QBR42062.1 DNA-deoxyinosine glycosylase [Kerstersia gyiorum]